MIKNIKIVYKNKKLVLKDRIKKKKIKKGCKTLRK